MLFGCKFLTSNRTCFVRLPTHQQTSRKAKRNSHYAVTIVTVSNEIQKKKTRSSLDSKFKKVKKKNKRFAFVLNSRLREEGGGVWSSEPSLDRYKGILRRCAKRVLIVGHFKRFVAFFTENAQTGNRLYCVSTNIFLPRHLSAAVRTRFSAAQ